MDHQDVPGLFQDFFGYYELVQEQMYTITVPWEFLAESKPLH